MIFSDLHELEIKNQEEFDTIVSQITSKVKVDSIMFIDSYKNPGQDSYNSDGGGLEIGYKFIDQFDNEVERNLFVVLSSFQQKIDSLRKFVIQGMVPSTVYKQQKEDAILTASALCNNIMKQGK